MDHGWQADWAMAKIFLTNLRTQVAQNHQKCANWVHLLQQFFSHLALNQIWIEISAWNFQHLFFTRLHKFYEKILAIAQSACQPWPILAKKFLQHLCIWINYSKVISQNQTAGAAIPPTKVVPSVICVCCRIKIVIWSLNIERFPVSFMLSIKTQASGSTWNRKSGRLTRRSTKRSSVSKVQ